MTDRCLADWLQLIEARHPCEIELGLDRVSEVWQRYTSGQPQNTQVRTPKIITVAGTNGKGSCIASMQAVLLEHGYSVGTFTSPHFLVYNERICLSGVPASDQMIVSAFECIETLRDRIPLTYFEFNTLAALIIFSRNDLHVLLLEVGLGGRLDAINIVDSDVAVLTSVDLDHQQWLGETRAEIAREKLGIARCGRPLIIGEQDYPEGFEQLVSDSKACPLWLGRDFTYSEQHTTFAVALATAAHTDNLTTVEDLNAEGLLPINKAVALQALVSAGCALDANKCRSALSAVTLTGRQQKVLYKGVSIILDVAHNPAAAGVLAEHLALQKGRKIAVASVLEDKDWASMVALLGPVVDRWEIAELTGISRAANGQSLLKLLYNSGVQAVLNNSIEQAFSNALSQAGDEDTIVVFGSFYTVAAVLDLIVTEVSGE